MVPAHDGAFGLLIEGLVLRVLLLQVLHPSLHAEELVLHHPLAPPQVLDVLPQVFILLVEASGGLGRAGGRGIQQLRAHGGRIGQLRGRRAGHRRRGSPQRGGHQERPYGRARAVLWLLLPVRVREPRQLRGASAQTPHVRRPRPGLHGRILGVAGSPPVGHGVRRGAGVKGGEAVQAAMRRGAARGVGVAGGRRRGQEVKGVGGRGRVLVGLPRRLRGRAAARGRQSHRRRDFAAGNRSGERGVLGERTALQWGNPRWRGQHTSLLVAEAALRR
mmetsp:Transcript_112832/g.324251  ORF Transcript_112832/g.324251 Transcript_112832/m.324251 type:complete len:275 (-) Transcript_112832:394-1218(-)